MFQSIADRSRFRLAVLFAGACAVAACGGGGGGGGGDSAPAPAPAPAAPLTLATCLQDPTGVTNTYLNTTRPRREWRAGTFLGQAVTARLEYADATTTHPSRAYYYQYDTTAHTVTTLGHEDFDAGGAVTRQEQFVGLVNSTTLAVGQNEAKTYTVKTLVPAATADRSERSTVTYEANQVISLTGGRTDSCRVKNVIESIAAGGAATQVSVETLHLVPGLGFVKSYYKPMTAGAPDRNQTYLTELVSTTGTLALAAPNADSPPTLTQCSALQTGLSLVLTASSSAEANSALRTSSAVTFNGAQAIAMERRNVVSNSRSSIDYYDPTVGYLRPVGNDTFDSTGALLFTRVARTGRPDLRSAGVTAAVNYVETYTALPPTIIPTVTSNDTFTFDGFAKVTTPAGTFDTCKVHFNFGSDQSTETYYFAPSLHWVRLDTTLQNGTRTTRELLSH